MTSRILELCTSLRIGRQQLSFNYRNLSVNNSEDVHFSTPSKGEVLLPRCEEFGMR